VLIDRCFPSISVSQVGINNYGASFDAVSHLVKTGRRRIGMIAYKTALHHINERKRGYSEALGKQAPLLKLARYAHIKEDTRQAIDQLLRGRKPADAVFFATNSLAIEGLRYINELGVRVPEDLAVVSFDESEAFDLYHSPITFIRQPILNMGRAAVRVLLEQLKESGKAAEQVCIDAELVIRQSSMLR